MLGFMPSASAAWRRSATLGFSNVGMSGLQPLSVMPGFMPGIHALASKQDVDGRDIGERSDAVFDGYARP